MWYKIKPLVVERIRTLKGKAVSTAKQVQAVKEPGRYRADPGLYLVVTKAGTKSWVQRISVKGQRKDIGLGGFPAVKLLEARRMAADNRAKASSGSTIRRKRTKRTRATKPSVPTFRHMALELYETKREGWRSEKYTTQWMQALDLHVFPVIGDMPVNEITFADVREVFDPLIAKHFVTARWLRGVVREIFEQAHY